MPTYEYACPTCGIVECFQSIKDQAHTRCPQCRKAKVTRLVSGGGAVIFRGSGFWETDYNRSPDYAKKRSADTAPVVTATTETGKAKAATGTAVASPVASSATKTPAKPDASKR